MKKTLLTFMCAAIASLYTTPLLAAVGDIFTATVNGIDMKFNVTAADEVQVYGTSTEPAIDKTTSAPVIIPATVEDGNHNVYKVTGIIKNAFYSCSGITSITLGENIKTIGNQAFMNCTGVTSITLNEGLTTIGQSVFRECANLTTINIPASVTTIAVSAFFHCYNLAEVHITDVAAWCSINFGNDSAHPCYSTTTCSLIVNNGTPNVINIPEGVTTIKPYAFFRCRALSEIYIPSTLTSIKKEAFRGCPETAKIVVTDLNKWCEIEYEDYTATLLQWTKNLYLGENLVENVVLTSATKIGDYAFNGNSNITSVQINNGVSSIGTEAFKGCTNLTTINIPASVTVIGSKAFSLCSSLARIDITDLGAWCETDFNDQFANPLFYTPNLYLNDELLVEANIPAGTTTIKEGALRKCTSLTSVTIPSSVLTIGANAFSGNPNITDVYCEGNTPATISENSFGTTSNEAYWKAIFHISFDALATYNATEIWNTMKNYMAELDETNLATGYAYTNDDSFLRGSSVNIKVNYKRNFNNTKWQALFVPFNMKYSDLSANFDVAAILDNQTAGEPINVALIKSGKLIAGKPYLIKAKSSGEKTLTATVTEMASCDDVVWNFGDCTYTGVYTTINGLKSIGAWAMAGGLLARPKSDEVTLKPFRWYMTEVSGAGVKEANLSFVIFDNGYEDAPDDEETAIEQVKSSTTTVANDAWYTLSGQRIAKPTQRGIYIKNGKKILF